MWKIILISFILGIIIGLVIMWLKQYKSTSNFSLKENHTKQHKINEYEIKLINHFVHIANLLNDINSHHCKFYQYMTSSVRDLLINKNIKYEKTQLDKNILKQKNNNDKLSNKQQPRDYSENTTNNS